MGSKSDLLRTLAAASGAKSATPGVRSSVLKWRRGSPVNIVDFSLIFAIDGALPRAYPADFSSNPKAGSNRHGPHALAQALSNRLRIHPQDQPSQGLSD